MVAAFANETYVKVMFQKYRVRVSPSKKDIQNPKVAPTTVATANQFIYNYIYIYTPFS